MRKTLVFFTLFAIIFLQNSVNIDAAEVLMTIHKIQEESNTTYEIKNISKKLRVSCDASIKLNYLIENYPLDPILLGKSENAYLSIDLINYSDALSYQYGEDQFSDDEGYMSITTCVYDYGTVQTVERLFYSTTYVNFKKEFKTRNQDILLFRTGEGAVQYFESSFSGRFVYEYALNSGTQHSQSVSIDYSSQYGIQYLFDLPKNQTIPGIGKNFAVRWKLNADFYFFAKSTTFVQVGYIHNENIFGNNLSVSIGALSVNISGMSTKYYGKGINIYV